MTIRPLSTICSKSEDLVKATLSCDEYQHRLNLSSTKYAERTRIMKNERSTTSEWNHALLRSSKMHPLVASKKALDSLVISQLHNEHVAAMRGLDLYETGGMMIMFSRQVTHESLYL